MKTSLCLFAALAAGSPLTHAQDTFSIEWFSLSGGSGPSTGTGEFTLDGSSIGQMSAGDTNNGVPGEFSLSGGYWTFTFEPPSGFAINLTGGVATLTWVSSGPPVILESSPNLSLWTPVSPQPTAQFFQEPATGVRRYYRLVPAGN